MATTISEGEGDDKLTFKFADKWQVYKYDEPITENFYHKIQHLGLKAVDFIAISENTVLLIEVKYISANNKNSRIRLSAKDDDAIVERVREKICTINLSNKEKEAVLIRPPRPYVAEEIIKKIKDTLNGLLASYRNSDQKLSSFNKSIFIDNKPIIFIFFIERKGEQNLPERFKPMASGLRIAIEQKIGFLGNIKVDVVNTNTLPQNLGIEVWVG